MCGIAAASRKGEAMTRRERLLLISALLMLDACMIGGALLAAYYLRIESGLLPGRAFGPIGEYMRSSLLAIPLWLTIMALNRLYDTRLLLEGLQEYIKVATACTYGLLALVLTAVFTSPGAPLPARGWLLLAWVFSIVFVSLARFAMRRLIVFVRGRGRFVTRVLIIGANAHGQALASQFHSVPGARLEVVGFLDDFLPLGAQVCPGPRGAPLEVIGAPNRLHEVAGRYQIREVILVPTAVAWETFQNLMQQAAAPHAFEILLSPGYYDILPTSVEISYRDFVPLLRINQMRLIGPDALIKAALDYGITLVAALLTAPLALALALAIRLSAKGPILERHLVWGVRGSAFTTYKFNTRFDRAGAPLAVETPSADRARQNPASTGTANADLSAQTGANRDPTLQPSPAGRMTARTPGLWETEAERLHPLARFMLRLGLDKLPQLINILAGHMSLIGPRTIAHSKNILIEPTLANLLTIKPGITGPWAVGGERSFDEEMRLTNYYIRNWTIWVDLQILLQTAIRILRGERAKARLPLSEEDFVS